MLQRIRSKGRTRSVTRTELVSWSSSSIAGSEAMRVVGIGARQMSVGVTAEGAKVAEESPTIHTLLLLQSSASSATSAVNSFLGWRRSNDPSPGLQVKKRMRPFDSPELSITTPLRTQPSRSLRPIELRADEPTSRFELRASSSSSSSQLKVCSSARPLAARCARLGRGVTP